MDNLYNTHLLECYKLGEKAREARRKQDESTAQFFTRHFRKIKGLYSDTDARNLQDNFDLGYKKG